MEQRQVRGSKDRKLNLRRADRYWKSRRAYPERRHTSRGDLGYRVGGFGDWYWMRDHALTAGVNRTLYHVAFVATSHIIFNQNHCTASSRHLHPVGSDSTLLQNLSIMILPPLT